MAKTKEYTVKVAGFINGAYYEEGGIVALTDAQARAYLARIEEAKPKPASKA